MSYDISIINTMPKTVDYSAAAGDDDSSIVEYTDKFEKDHDEVLQACISHDLGGIIVYLKQGVPIAVYDYENFGGWIF